MTSSGNDRSANSTPTHSPCGDELVSTSATENPQSVAQTVVSPENDLLSNRPKEHGGQAGLEPTRYGDWEKKGRCTDF